MDLRYSSLTRMELYSAEAPSLNSSMLVWATGDVSIEIWKEEVKQQPYSFMLGDRVTQALAYSHLSCWFTLVMWDRQHWACSFSRFCQILLQFLRLLGQACL